MQSKLNPSQPLDPPPDRVAGTRPFALDPLFRGLGALPGVGPKNGKLLEKLIGGPKILDLLFHKPVDFVDRRFAPPIKDVIDGRVATLELIIDKHIPNARKGQPYRVWCRDAGGAINLVFFHAHADWLTKQLPPGEKRIVSGRVEFFNGAPQIVHPDMILKPEQRGELEAFEPVYPLTAGITNKFVRKAVQGALAHLPALPEWQDTALIKRKGWKTWDESMKELHFMIQPNNPPTHPPPLKRGEVQEGGRRLAYDELLANQLTLAIVRERQKKQKGRVLKPDLALRQKMLSALPFQLTNAQKRALQDIDADMAAPSRMLRLLQGDVGSGKTVVACLALLNAVANNAQAAFLAPTEILARQHAKTIAPWLDAAGIPFAVFTGRDKGKARGAILAEIASGHARVIIGTHAIFQDKVEFAELGLAVIDEQHRFGVHQRLSLSDKGKATDILLMTATPIPRTLTLTAYGDMDVSRLDEKPPGRKPIDTRLIAGDKMEDMIGGIARQIQAGARVYWVCPLVEDSEILDLAAAEERFDVLRARFGGRVGLLHGRMKPAEKNFVMQKFSEGDLDILVATTVIEVGVDVPAASVMVIEHAERFGLAQLHQLRGRVGRGSAKSYCFLMYAGPLGETAKERLATMRDTEDGFLIAEKDLELRGGGDILGLKQSGLPHFRLADLAAHADLLKIASDDARLIMARDPLLKSKRGVALRTLLYLFERDQAIQYLRSG